MYLCKVENLDSKQLIFFDGVCNLCNSSIQFIIKRDKKDQFRFAALQSAMGEAFIRERQIDTSKVDSIILYEPDIAYYTKSTAALKIGQAFGGGYKLLAIFEWIPRPIRDWFYDRIAKNRYRWFGKQDACMIPTPELTAKFVG
ncbi:MAG: DUF393 domain-containing protein [Bacteroidota bacterium]